MKRLSMRSYKLLLARKTKATRSPLSRPCGNNFANIVPAQRACSAGLTTNTPRLADVPDDNPTLMPLRVGAKSRSCSARCATAKAACKSMPTVFMALKCCNMMALFINGHASSGWPIKG